MNKIEIETDLKTNVIIDNDIKENLKVFIDNNRTITLILNKNKLFSNLYNREVIIGLINRELLLLLDEHLKTMSIKENKVNGDL
jgi:hypothetical protein